MGGGSGVRGVYPDAALYSNEFSITNEYASNLMVGLRSSDVAVGGTGTESGSLWGASSGAPVGSYNPYAPTIELIVPDYVNPYAPTLEFVVPSGIASESKVTGETSIIVPAPTLPPDPPPVPTPQPEAEPAPVPNGPGKPL